MERFAAGGVEVELKPEFRVKHILEHDFAPATYIDYHGWLLVVVDDEIVTIHRGRAKHWER